MSQRKRFACDIDEFLNDLVYQVVKSYNAVYRQNLNYYSIDQYDIRPFLVPECKNIWQEFCTEETIRNLHVEDTAVETLPILNKKLDLYFVTAGHPNTMRARDQWLASKFDFYKSKMLIGCQNKQLLKMDYMGDDYHENLVGGDYQGFLMNRSWNRSFDAEAHGIIRINKVSDVLKYI
jgi:5'(3')-deoxyribonucleotidase